MARYRGTYTTAANYELLKAGPFDARQLVETKADLINPATWRQSNGDIWIYVGMMVAVAADENPNNNGVYVLKNKAYTVESSWEKQATEQDIQNLQQQIDNLEVTSGSLDITLNSKQELPTTGDLNTTYYIQEDSSIYRWDAQLETYVQYGGGSAPDLDNITLIHGGNANVTN